MHLEGICYQTLLTRMITATPQYQYKYVLLEDGLHLKTITRPKQCAYCFVPMVIIRLVSHDNPHFSKCLKSGLTFGPITASCSHSFIHIFLLLTSHPLEMVLACFKSVKSFDIFLLSIKTNLIFQQKLNRHMKTTSSSAVKTEHVN